MEEKLQKLTQEKKTTQNAIAAEWVITKLIELSKKYRDQIVKMALKTKCKNLEATLIFINDDIERQRTELKYQLLCSEMGKNISISTLLSTPGDWRGAEQIRCLQQKLVELQNSGNGRSQKELSLSNRKNLTCLRNAEKERRQQIENIAKELRQAEVALETSKRKLDASKARVKVLEQELSIMKGNIATLNEKRSHDNRLIDVLIERLKISEARYQDREVEVQMERENANIKNELRATQLHVDRLRRRLEEREIEIDKLRQTRQSFAIGIDVAATKPRYGDVTGTRDKVQRLHVNPRDIVGVKLAVSSPPRSSTVPLTSRRFSVCLNRLVYFCH
ncbi:CCD13 protein, partial [Acromyrmex charruanus]